MAGYSAEMQGAHSRVIHYMVDGNRQRRNPTDDQAWIPSVECGHCGAIVPGEVVALDENRTIWMCCPNCNKGIMETSGVRWPPSLPGEHVEHLPDLIASLFGEARRSLGMNAPTACVLVCRTIVGHVAIDCGWDKSGGFLGALDAVIAAGWITPPMRPWIDRIRRYGNEAAHDVDPIESGTAIDTLAFTSQLLRLVYEMPGKMLPTAP